MTISPELTFLPAKAPHRFVSEAAAIEVACKINALFGRSGEFEELCLLAKPDRFPIREGAGYTDYYLIEIVPYTHWNDWTMVESDHDAKERERLFKILRNRFGLVPTVVKSGKVERHWPNGGCHFHVGMDLFAFDRHFYTNLGTFHDRLARDYANRPYIRWLFAQWFDDLNSRTIYNEESFDEIAHQDLIQWADIRAAINARFASGGKTRYPTFEFRFFSMSTAAEVRLMARFLIHWIDHVKEMKATPEVTIKPRDFHDRFRDLKGIEREIAAWFTELKLSWQHYVPFFKRNYVNRIRYGKLV